MRKTANQVTKQETTDDLDALLAALPTEIVERLRGFANRADLLEVVLDLGRRPEARFTHGEEVLLEREIVEADIAHVIDHIGAFGGETGLASSAPCTASAPSETGPARWSG